MPNKDIWDKLKTPPPSALKKIQAGRLKGKSDISPQWRYEIMTEVFGPCGMGWNFSIEKLWTEPGSAGQVFAFAHVHVAFKDGDTWSTPVPGIGGSMLIANESKGPYSSDEAFKMATTDAVGTALKMIGVAADVYAGKCDGKNSMPPHNQPKPKPQPAQLPPMNEHEIAAMTSVFLIAITHKPVKQDEKAFKTEAANKLHKIMGHWPTTQQEQEEAISILDKEYKK